MKTIYLADLTHTTVTISNDSFPLNVGYVAAYADKIFGDQFEIELFKYPEDLKEAIDKKQPDIMGFSNYPWNLSLNISFMKWLKNLNPEIITLMGGPNISYDHADQTELLKSNKDYLDFYCLYEGEKSFAGVCERALETSFNIQAMKSKAIPGVLFLTEPGERVVKLNYEPLGRNPNLDELPSPYLSGYLDKFFDNKLSPLLETHRGCPFSCTYCHEGHVSYTKVNQFSTDRVNQEMEYIAQRIGGTVDNLMFADPNFGMYKRDVEIAKKISELNESYGYPKSIFASTAKNRKQNLIDISKQLKNVYFPIWMSVQSMSEDVLKKIKRKNISIEQMIGVQEELKTLNGNNSYSEVIMSLPGDTYQTHIQSIVDLVRLKIRQISTYQLMLVNGSEMHESKETQETYKFETKNRVLPRSFTELDGPGRSIEIEEIVVGTKDFPYEDYLKARELHLLIAVAFNTGTFEGYLSFLDEVGVDRGDFLFKLVDAFREHSKLRTILNDFLMETEKELFDSEEALLEHYSNDENYQKLITAEEGANLLQKYTSVINMDFPNELVEVFYIAASQLIEDKHKEKLQDIDLYYSLSFYLYLDNERQNKLSYGSFKYDIPKWLGSEDAALDEFSFSEKKTIYFETENEKYTQLENNFERSGRNVQAFGKIMTRLSLGDFLRTPLYEVENQSTGKEVVDFNR